MSNERKGGGIKGRKSTSSISDSLPSLETIESTIEEAAKIVGPKGLDRERRYTVTLYPEVYTAVRKRVTEIGTMSLTEYVNRATAKVLKINIEIPFHNRPFKPGNRLDATQTTDSLFGLLDMTPLGTKNPNAKKKENR